MKLITATPSPFARKVRVALLEKNISYEEIIDIPWNLDTKTNGINPLGKIPILLLKDQEPMFDSKVINQYLDYLEPNPLLYPRSFQENISARLLETVADGICDSVVLVFLENSRNKDLRSKNWIKRQEKKIFEGEIRTFTFMGEIITSCIKVPAEGNYLANTSAGAVVKDYQLTGELKQKIESLSKQLLGKGIYMVGYDIIGDLVSEINITSPRLLAANVDDMSHFEKISELIEDDLRA